jgi:uncharacterized protein
MATLNSNLRKKFFQSTFRVVFFAVCLFWTGFLAFAQTTQSPLPPPQAPVNDYANVIDEPTEQRLNSRLKKLQAEQNIEMAVVTIKTTGGQDIFNYSLAVARGWGIGSKADNNPSLLLLVAIDDKKYFTQTSRDMEGYLPDGVVGQIQREKLVPPFKQGLYAKGINDTIETYIATLEEKKARGDKPQAQSADEGIGVSGTVICCVIIVIIAIFIILIVISKRSAGGGRPNRNSSGWGGGGFGGIPIPIPINTGGSDWSGSSDSGSSWGGGSSDSGGSDWGGFGGGGDFGGGGAGGDW